MSNNDALATLLAERRAAIAALGEQLKAAAQRRADGDRAAHQADLDAATSRRDAARAKGEADVARARTDAEARAASARTEASKTRTDADQQLAAARTNASASVAGATASSATQVNTATAARDQARLDGAARVARAQADAAAAVQNANTAAAAQVAAAEAEKARKIAAANAQLQAAQGRKAEVAEDQAELDARRAQMAEESLHYQDQFTLLGYHGWYGSWVQERSNFAAWTQGWTEGSALFLRRSGAWDDNGAVRYGDQVLVGHVNGRYLTGNQAGDVGMSSAPGAWEVWTLLDPRDLNARGLVPRKARIALRSVHNRWLVAEENGVINANRTALGPWEQWVLDVRKVVRVPPPVVGPVIDIGPIFTGPIMGGGW